MSRLTAADQAIRNILKTKEKDALLEPLRRALDSESSAVFAVISKCKNDVTTSPCSTIFRGLFDATTKVVEAILQVTDGTKKEAVEALYKAFEKEQNKTEKLHQLATDVLNALEQH
ncbi:unnamed protein product [Nippostrongylus brasiliensis]|uniref:CULLIN_2 domain-containing protein n=1 Tax=Nippostrongylus brasiliensis TaxID=27835 RepID=A0A0N4XF27_NIPBR|nr:unnamed protein product [Nippostrongylus brasiliensis]